MEMQRVYNKSLVPLMNTKPRLYVARKHRVDTALQTNLWTDETEIKIITRMMEGEKSEEGEKKLIAQIIPHYVSNMAEAAL